MRDQKVWSLPKFERLHIDGWGMNIYKQHCFMFQVTHKVKQKKLLTTSSVKKTTIRIQVKLRFSFLIAEGQILALYYMSAFARSFRICG